MWLHSDAGNSHGVCPILNRAKFPDKGRFCALTTEKAASGRGIFLRDPEICVFPVFKMEKHETPGCVLIKKLKVRSPKQILLGGDDSGSQRENQNQT